MKKILVLALSILVLGIGTASADSNDFSYTYRQVRGKKGRKYVRYFLLRQNLAGDKKAVFETYGYTPHRLRFDTAGEKTERWTYFNEGLEFVFDDEGNLISERQIAREEGHIE